MLACILFMQGFLPKLLLTLVLFQKNLENIQGLKVSDEKEQLFIDLMFNLIIKKEQTKYPFRIFLVNDTNQILFNYDWQNDIFYCQYNRVWLTFKDKFNLDFQSLKQFIKSMVETHFKFKPATTDHAFLPFPFTVNDLL